MANGKQCDCEMTKVEKYAVLMMHGVLQSPYLVVPRDGETMFEAYSRYAVDLSLGLSRELARRDIK